MAMDPHSRLSQFNQRPPKSGPYMPTSRFMEPSPKPKLDYLPKRSSSAPSAQKSPSSPLLLTPRPIATNSRIKNDEKFRKDMYLSFINNALQQNANVSRFLAIYYPSLIRRILQGNTEPFDELVNQFNTKRTTEDGAPIAAQLRLWMLALSHVVSRLERQHSALVEAIVNMPWTTMDSALVKSYTIFIGMLLSARPEYLSIVLSKIAQGFTHRA
jgi:RNA polymerase I-specific transcription initiation factor RRN3